MAKPLKKKILVNVWQPLITKLNEMVEAACLQRDAYLDHVFRHEARRLDKEVDIPNSDAARDHLVKHLGLLNKKPVNFALSPETVARIDNVCKRKNVPRDSFINRVLLFLVAEQLELFEKILPIDFNDYWDRNVSDMMDSLAVAYIREQTLSIITDLVSDDPFWTIRWCIEDAIRDEEPCDPLHKILISSALFGEKFTVLGLNCYLPDWEIERHPLTSDIPDGLIFGMKVAEKSKSVQKQRTAKSLDNHVPEKQGDEQ
jgi:hypothetical protein